MARTQFSLTVGALVSTSLGIFLRNLIPFVVLAAVVLSPWIVFRLTVMEDPTNIWAPFVGMILQSVLGFVLTGALTYGVVQQLREQPAGVAQVLNVGMQSFLRVLGTSLLCGVRIFLFSLLLWVPGIIETCRLFVAIPAAVMEGKGAGASIDRSIRLTDGSRWPIFGAWLLMLVVAIGLGAVGGFMIGAMDPEQLRGVVWLELGIALLVTPFSATMGSAAYFLLRRGKENVEPKQIAAVFD